jgi:hypothetical protein
MLSLQLSGVVKLETMTRRLALVHRLETKRANEGQQALAGEGWNRLLDDGVSARHYAIGAV